MDSAITSDLKEKLPRGLYRGKITVIDNSLHVDNVVNKLMNSKILGFDTETKPSFKKGPRNKVSLLQFCSSEGAFLIRINKTGFHTALVKLFENESVMKVGIGIRDDLQGLKKLRQFQPCGFTDLQDLSQKLGFKALSLKGMAAEVLNLWISKRQRLTNWDAEKLTSSQISYAATDAWIALSIYNKMMNSNVDFTYKNNIDS